MPGRPTEIEKGQTAKQAVSMAQRRRRPPRFLLSTRTLSWVLQRLAIANGYGWKAVCGEMAKSGHPEEGTMSMFLPFIDPQ